MIIVFTGNGKGKTTAAIGQAVRALGNGAKVLMVQFIKGPWKSGEDEASKAFGENFHIEKTGKGFVGTICDKLPIEEHKKAAKSGLTYALKELKKGAWDILILDEIWVALGLGLFDKAEVASLISDARPLCQHIILTGRGCPAEFIEKADLVTEMTEIKHPFATGAGATKGIEY